MNSLGPAHTKHMSREVRPRLAQMRDRPTFHVPQAIVDPVAVTAARGVSKGGGHPKKITNPSDVSNAHAL